MESEFDLEVRFRPGRVNSNANALSRAPVCDDDVTEDSAEETQVAQVSATREEVSQPLLEVADLQRSDAELGPILLYLSVGVLPENPSLQQLVAKERDRLVILDGVLHYVDPARKDRSRMAVPVMLRQKLMEEVHSGGFSGHFAVRGLYEKLARRYWWKGMYSDVHRFCQGCLTCAAHGGGGRRTRPPLRSIPVGAPFERIGVDLMEMPLTARGSRYVIVFLDYLTKWVEAYPIPARQ